MTERSPFVFLRFYYFGLHFMNIVPNIVNKNTTTDPKSSQNQEKWVPGVTGELPEETPGPKRRPGEKNTSKKDFLPPNRGAHSDTFSALFSFRASGTLKKGGPGGPPKLDPFVGPFGGLPEGLRRVHSLARAQFSLLQPDPKRVPKFTQNGAFWGARGATILIWG